MPKSVSKFHAAIVPIAVAAALMAAPAFAADAVDPALKAALQRDLGLSGPQLARYLAIERLADRQQQALQARQGRHFAGSWIEQQPGGAFSFVVATTSVAPQAAATGIEIRRARHSLASLDAAKARLDDLLARGAKVPTGVYGWYVDLPGNSVVVSVGRGGQQAGIDFVAASGIDTDLVRLETAQVQPSLHVDVLGGRGYLRDPGDGYVYACSVGFSVRQNGTPGFATAGHCGDAGEIVYNEPSKWVLGAKLGKFAASRFPAPGKTGNDFAWVRVDAAHALRPKVEGYSGADATVRGKNVAAVGAAVCRSGRTTGWRCGRIEARNQTVHYSSGETVVNLARTTACSEGGDSGGSFITGPGQAQGVLSGGSGDCQGSPPGSTRSYFQPLNPILNTYNLTLLAKP